MTQYEKDCFCALKVILAMAIVALFGALWLANTPEQEPECQKPTPQLSEILK